MIKACEFLEMIKENGIALTTGVPCSSLSELFHTMHKGKALPHFGTTTEGEAIGLSAGSWLAGKQAAIFCQNSGIGNMINPLSSLNVPYAIPANIWVSMRGAPGHPDEVQHDIMGARGGDFLRLTETITTACPTNLPDIREAFIKAAHRVSERTSHAFLINPGTFENAAFKASENEKAWKKGDFSEFHDGCLTTRMTAIESFYSLHDKSLIIATTGMTSRELHAVAGEHKNHFLMTGSMGHASSIGLGLALNTQKSVMILDGDGALLMKMGTCATIGRYAPPNLMHVVLDNGVHGSTGGSSSNANTFNFAMMAQAAGYNHVVSCFGQKGIEEAAKKTSTLTGPLFVHCIISPEEKTKAPRPEMDMKEHALKFRQHMLN